MPKPPPPSTRGRGSTSSAATTLSQQTFGRVLVHAIAFSFLSFSILVQKEIGVLFSKLAVL